jgi:glycosyltransferase involved in cell wall biosynthesis
MNQIADVKRIERHSRRVFRITMLGVRGFPNVQGGVEKHAENLACALAGLGCDVEVIVRSGYVTADQPTRWRGVALTRVWAPHMSGAEAFVHTFLGVLRAAVSRPNILHIHAIGPAFFTPLAWALGLRVVVTYHSQNYQHKKWGPFGRAILRLGERAGMAFARGRIAVSDGLAEVLAQRYEVPVSTIPNGIEPPRRMRSTDVLQAFGLEANRYILMVARLDEDKRQLDLISACTRMQMPNWKLALVGAADHSSAYARQVEDAARNHPGIVLLGHQSGAALAELYSHAGTFVLPSSQEGQPIAVLEAASYGLPLILSDIPAHREIAIPRVRYFTPGDIDVLADHLRQVCSAAERETLTSAECATLLAKHDWRLIAERTLAVYCDAFSGSRSGREADSPMAKIEEGA